MYSIYTTKLFRKVKKWKKCLVGDFLTIKTLSILKSWTVKISEFGSPSQLRSTELQNPNLSSSYPRTLILLSDYDCHKCTLHVSILVYNPQFVVSKATVSMIAWMYLEVLRWSTLILNVYRVMPWVKCITRLPYRIIPSLPIGHYLVYTLLLLKIIIKTRSSCTA